MSFQDQIRQTIGQPNRAGIGVLIAAVLLGVLVLANTSSSETPSFEENTTVVSPTDNTNTSPSSVPAAVPSDSNENTKTDLEELEELLVDESGLTSVEAECVVRVMVEQFDLPTERIAADVYEFDVWLAESDANADGWVISLASCDVDLAALMSGR